MRRRKVSRWVKVGCQKQAYGNNGRLGTAPPRPAPFPGGAYHNALDVQRDFLNQRLGHGVRDGETWVRYGR